MVACPPGLRLAKIRFLHDKFQIGNLFCGIRPGRHTLLYIVLCHAARWMSYSAKDGENRSGKTAFLGPEN